MVSVPMDSSALTIVGILFIFGGAFVWYRAKQKTVRITGGGRTIFEQFTRDLTEDAAAGRLDPVIGRDGEIERVVQILSRRRKSNPLLIGDPGVGKTAIVEGLARRIQKGYVPNVLKNKRLLALDLTSMISGTKFRGEFEERMRRLTEELTDMKRTVILFIDEVHMLEQAGGVEGGMNVSDILKPALARGDMQAIGATTSREYEKSIKPDDALNRRFQPIIVGEPSREDTITILREVKKIYEEYHGVVIDDDAIVAAVDLSAGIKDRFLPDRAFDLIDEACAKIAIESTNRHVDSRVGHDVAAAKILRERAASEISKLMPVIERLDGLDKDFPNDMEIERAGRVLKRHVTEMEAGATQPVTPDGTSRVTTDTIQKIIKEWTVQTGSE